MSLDEAAWTEIARLWQTGELPVTAIAERFGLSRQKLVAVARLRMWPARASGKPGPARSAIQAGAGKRRQGSAGDGDDGEASAGVAPRAAAAKPTTAHRKTRQSRRDMLQRLFDAVDAKLIRLERHMADDGDATAADGERTARSLNSLIRSFEKLTAFEDKLGKDAGQRGARVRDGGERETTEHRRQELARRIAKLRQQR
ncbi:MAG: hypothetical protein ACK4MF_01015 [Hyphomicrobiaceae bacterium]